MTETVVVAAVARTAVRAADGELARWHPVELAGVVGQEALERAGLEPGDLDEVIVGCADPVGACGADAARAIVLAAGWPDAVGGQVVDRGETSGLAAVQAAAAAIRSGQATRVLVIGLGLCSVVAPGAAALNRAYGAPWGGVAERLAARGGLLPGPRLSERAAQAAGLGRADLDAAAEESRRRRQAAGGSGAVVAVAARPGDAAGPYVRRGDPVTDDIVREWGEAADLPPTFDEDGLLTAATFAPPADCIAAVLLHSVTVVPAGSGTSPGAAIGTPARQLVDAVVPAGSGTSPGVLRHGPVEGGAATAEAARSDGPARETDPAEPPGTATTTAEATQTSGPARETDPAEPPGTATTTAEATQTSGLSALAGVGRAAGDPFDPAGSVAAAVGRALAEAGLALDDVADIAVAEHDATTARLVARALGVDPARINRSGGAVATGSAGPAEELRLITDGLAGATASAGTHLLAISTGPTGSAAILLRRGP